MDVREITSMSDDVIQQREIFKYVYKNKPTWQVLSNVSSFEEDFKKKKLNLSLRTLKNELTVD